VKFGKFDFKSKGSLWLAAAANLLLVGMAAIDAAVFALGLGVFFAPFAIFSLVAVACAPVLALTAVGLEIRKIRDARRSGEKQWSKGTWLSLGLAAIPLLAGLAAVIWVLQPLLFY
jgi:uncharacterized membrane protein YhaH (DUF805 family)